MRLLCSVLFATALLVCACTEPTLAASQSSGQVYTWVDKNGVRHYSDRPHSPKAKAVRNLSASPPASPATVPTSANASAPHPAHKAPAARSAARARHSLTPKERAALCAKLKDQLQRIESARRVKVTENGTSRYLSGEDLIAFKHILQHRMEGACAPPRA